MKLVIVITGASSGFGALAARALADTAKTYAAKHNGDPQGRCSDGISNSADGPPSAVDLDG